jgi:hypothetical protein
MRQFILFSLEDYFLKAQNLLKEKMNSSCETKNEKSEFSILNIWSDLHINKTFVNNQILDTKLLIKYAD